jgi:uncharacterized membrane protein
MARRGEALTVAGEQAASGALKRAPLWDGAVALLALVGLVDAGYLTTEHLAGRIGNVPCMVTTDCGGVLTSSYATLPGDIPLAALGALAYFAAFSLATLAAFGYDSARKFLLPLVLTMFAASLWLLYVQAFVLEAFCSYCLLSAALSTTMTALVVLRWRLDRKHDLS